jgi:hypothetical protein
VAALAEMYVQGVSTRKVKAITEELCGQEFSASSISTINKRVDEELERFMSRRLEEDYPHLILDARYEKVRLEGVIRSRAVLVSPAEQSESAIIASLQSETAALKTQVAALQKQVAAINASSVMKLVPYVSLDTNMENFVQAPNIVFSGANIHIVNGTGNTSIVNGKGNLIIGYDELPGYDGSGIDYLATDYPALAYGEENRWGSHNVVIGRGHYFAKNAFGGLLAGENNAVSGEANSVLGGKLNYAAGPNAVISGGYFNQSGSFYTSVSGGLYNVANGFFSSVVCGYNNVASGNYSNIFTGSWQTASATYQILPAYAPKQ